MSDTMTPESQPPTPTPTPTPKSPTDNEYSAEELNDVVKSVASALAESMSTDDKVERAKASSDETKANAYTQVHNVFETFGLDREAKATDYKKNGHYMELQRDICELLSKKTKSPVKTSKRGDSIFSDRVKKQWSRLVTAYRQENEGTQSEADVAGKKTLALKNKHNAAKAAVFDVLAGVLRDPEATTEALDAIHARVLATSDQLDNNE